MTNYDLTHAVATYPESFTNEPIVAAGALSLFADELATLRHACRSKRFTGDMAGAQAWHIADRLRCALGLDARLRRAVPLASALENAADDTMSRERASAEFVLVVDLLARRAKRMCTQIVKADPSFRAERHGMAVMQ
jgi:hypothetical protein